MATLPDIHHVIFGVLVVPGVIDRTPPFLMASLRYFESNKAYYPRYLVQW